MANWRSYRETARFLAILRAFLASDVLYFCERANLLTALGGGWGGQGLGEVRDVENAMAAEDDSRLAKWYHEGRQRS